MKKSVKFRFIFSLAFLLIFSLTLFFSVSFISAGTLQVTEEHPFLVNGQWVDASQLQVGDVLQTLNGKNVRITGIEDVVLEDNFSVYNLEAKEYSDFVVNGGDGLGVVVHNSNYDPKIYNHGYVQTKEGPVKIVFADMPKGVGGFASRPSDIDFYAPVIAKKLNIDLTKESLIVLSKKFLNKRVSNMNLEILHHEIIHAESGSEASAFAGAFKRLLLQKSVKVDFVDGTSRVYKPDVIQTMLVYARAPIQPTIHYVMPHIYAPLYQRQYGNPLKFFLKTSDQSFDFSSDAILFYMTIPVGIAGVSSTEYTFATIYYSIKYENK